MGIILAPRNTWQCLETYLVVKTVGGANGNQWVEAKDANTHPTMLKSAPPQIIIQPKMLIVARLRNAGLQFNNPLNSSVEE